MKRVFYILTIPFLATACDQTISRSETIKVDPVNAISDTLKGGSSEKPERKIVSDSLVFYSDSLYRDPKLKFVEIADNEFQSYKAKYKTACVLDSGQFISGSDLYVSHACDEICESFLCERTTNRRMFLPFTKNWAIEDLTWVNDKTITLKVYEGNRAGDGSSVHYKYLKADIHK